MKKNILVVDDNEDIVDLISYELLHKGFNVLFASNGEDAFNVLNSEKIDLLLSDIQMPGCDGIALMKRVKASEHNPICILMTGLAHVPPEDIKGTGVKGIFYKPVNRAELFKFITNALKD